MMLLLTQDALNQSDFHSHGKCHSFSFLACTFTDQILKSLINVNKNTGYLVPVFAQMFFKLVLRINAQTFFLNFFCLVLWV